MHDFICATITGKQQVWTNLESRNFENLEVMQDHRCGVVGYEPGWSRVNDTAKPSLPAFEVRISELLLFFNHGWLQDIELTKYAPTRFVDVFTLNICISRVSNKTQPCLYQRKLIAFLDNEKAYFA
jgi:hypothetical protein